MFPHLEFYDQALVMGVTEDPPENEECEIIGEELAPDGKVWFSCTETAVQPGAECETIGQDFGNAVGLPQDGDKLCKVII